MTEHKSEHQVLLPEGEFIVLLEGYFPDPTKSVNAGNNYQVAVTDRSGSSIFDEEVRFTFKNKEKKDGAQQILSDIKPGKTSKRVLTLDASVDRNLTITILRGRCDTVANELYLRIRQKRG